MAKTWVLAANAGEARLFLREKKFGPLTEVQDFLHAESRLPRKDLEHGRQGKTFSSMGHDQSDNQKQTDPKKREAGEFARELADYLESGRIGGEFDRLALVADPSFLGLLRDHLDDATRKLVDVEVSKNLAKESTEAIAEAVDSEH